METTPSAAAVMESQVAGLVEMVEVVTQGYKEALSNDPLVLSPREYTGKALMLPPLSLRWW
jgi:hypothetical protein